MHDDLLVKICGITSEADALLAVGLGADAVGFILAPSPRQVAPQLAADIVKRLPHEVLTVAVFRDEARSRVVELANTAGFGAVQLHGHEKAEDAVWIRARVACTIKAFPAGDPAIGRFEDFGADYLLIDGPSPGSGSVFDWRLAEGVVDPGRMFASGGLHPGNVADAIAALKPRGVDVSSGVESSPGVKDPQKLRAFIHAARAASRTLTGARVADSRDAAQGATAGRDARASPDVGAFAGDTEESSRTPYDWMDG
jgi:phosphoribosylanthranilate isomerase